MVSKISLLVMNKQRRENVSHRLVLVVFVQLIITLSYSPCFQKSISRKKKKKNMSTNSANEQSFEDKINMTDIRSGDNAEEKLRRRRYVLRKYSFMNICGFFSLFSKGALKCCTPKCYLASTLAVILLLSALGGGLTALFLRVEPKSATKTTGMSSSEPERFVKLSQSKLV